jgi:hypothetical protein
VKTLNWQKLAFYVLLFVVIFLAIRLARAQSVISVDFTKAILTWTEPVICTSFNPNVPAGCGGTPDVYHVKCKVRNAADLPVFDVPHPTVSVPVASLVPGPGKYECFVTAENAFPPESGASNTLPFDAGTPSGTPTNLLLGVIP